MEPTTPVRFDFRPYGLGCFSHMHELPSSFVGPNANLQAKDTERFHNAIDPILAQHQEECLRASSPQCTFCGSPIAKALQQPGNSLFHSRETDGRDPSIQVLVMAVCKKAECEVAGKNAMTEVTMQALGDQARADKGGCHVCGKVEGTSRCAGCKTVSYCGKDCQRKHWKSGHGPPCKKFQATGRF